MKLLKSDKKSDKIIPNIAQMLQQNVQRLGNKIACQEKKEGEYKGISWNEFYNDIENIAFNLKRFGFSKGDKIVLFSPNRLEMLELELAVMASGGIAVPIFAWFKKDTAELLINHSDAKYLAVSGEHQLDNIDPNLLLNQIFVFDNIEDKRFPNMEPFTELLKEKSSPDFTFNTDAQPDEICLNMYTSGTMGTPKCVQLTHKNILSQQAARKTLWDIDENDRLLSYLPWHHSFGGIFELFTALCYGATLSLESGYGKDPKVIMENWKLIKPTIFFSVPKVYQALVDLTKESKEAEALFFHSGLKFIFTAAAPLSEKLSLEFEKRNIPVIEGWGLTETSPCCTLTDPKIKRETGVIGKPIPEVSIRIADDGEIQVKGPNVMAGYYNNEEANADVFTKDGWFRTGDVGEFTETGLKLITRKDRIFKLSNGEKVIPTDLEKLIEKKCHYIAYALVTGKGEEYPVALLFPNRDLLNNPGYEVTPLEGCFCPKTMNEYAKCLHGCLNDANCAIGQKFARVKAAMLIDDELSIENNTLTPSMKVAPNNVIKTYRAHLENLYGADFPVTEEVFVVRL
ncbi:MAG: AMP-binding protein [Cytophagales bacterium]|nr:AMP-binding protein [Cytophagales bacterium]